MEHDTFMHPRQLSAPIHGHPDAPKVFSAMLEHIASAETEYFELELTG
ncbi:MAG TPA: hypothetical protein VF157_12530 [Chloroflexota bacterium]